VHQGVGDVSDQVAGALDRHPATLGPLAVDELAQRLALHDLGHREQEITLATDGHQIHEVLVPDRLGLLQIGEEAPGAMRDPRERDDPHGAAAAGHTSRQLVAGDGRRPVDMRGAFARQEGFQTETSANDGARRNLRGAGGGF
jgi:hypothetical protein